MRRTPSHIDHRDQFQEAGGAAVPTRAFDSAYADLVSARVTYDRFAGDETHVPELARASRRLAEARAAMAAVRAA